MHNDQASAHACAAQKDRWRHQMAALSSIAQVLNARSGQSQTLHDILQVLEQTLGMVRTTVMLLAADEQRLVIGATRSVPPDQAQSVHYQRGEGITGRVLESGRSVVVPSVSSEPEFVDRIHQRARRHADDSSFICVPIMVGREVIGTLAADLPPGESGQRDADELDEAERALTIVAAMIGFDVRVRRDEREEHEALQEENLRLRDALEERFRPENIIGNSRPMRAVYTRIRRVATGNTTVLIRGETGTGKELVASAIHYSSGRSNQPYIRVNCAQLSETLLESELFGHEKGAFTGAIERRIGRIEEAENGTLFLDEIGDFPPAIQVKLLRFLQEHEFERVGSNETLTANVRVIAATNCDLESALKEKTFRQDLYYRINVFPIVLPALRERRDDILLLANHFAEKYAREMGKQIRRFSTPAIDMLMAYHWPGNVRELENCIEHAILLADGDAILGHHLPPTLEMPDAADDSVSSRLDIRVEALERDMISDALKCASGNAAAAARQLGITARMIRYKMKKLGLET
ncbi:MULTISPECIES: sigma 54-interacting transcriptional regulator [Crateriforma]|nr:MULTISPECIES: sigma 54-interacting transcriptional regulator [Crateriforma]